MDAAASDAGCGFTFVGERRGTGVAIMTSKKIKCSHRLVNDHQEVFKDHIGTQIYLAVASSHIRSQYFHEAILSVIESVRKEFPASVDELKSAFRVNGQGDMAASHPWKPSSSYESGRGWKMDKPESYHQRHYNAERDAYETQERAKSDAKYAELLLALCGRDTWIIDLMPQETA